MMMMTYRFRILKNTLIVIFITSALSACNINDDIDDTNKDTVINNNITYLLEQNKLLNSDINALKSKLNFQEEKSVKENNNNFKRIAKLQSDIAKLQENKDYLKKITKLQSDITKLQESISANKKSILANEKTTKDKVLTSDLDLMQGIIDGALIKINNINKANKDDLSSLNLSIKNLENKLNLKVEKTTLAEIQKKQIDENTKFQNNIKEYMKDQKVSLDYLAEIKKDLKNENLKFASSIEKKFKGIKDENLKFESNIENKFKAIADRNIKELKNIISRTNEKLHSFINEFYMFKKEYEHNAKTKVNSEKYQKTLIKAVKDIKDKFKDMDVISKDVGNIKSSCAKMNSIIIGFTKSMDSNKEYIETELKRLKSNVGELRLKDFIKNSSDN